MARKTLYMIIDTETTKKNGMVFDVAFDLCDKYGSTVEHGSFLIKDVLAIEEPFYKQKIAEYWTLVYKQKAKPMSLRAIRRAMNNTISRYLNKGYKVVITAYNAKFDVDHLGLTCANLLSKTFLETSNKSVLFLDLWHAWVMGCPIDFGYFSPFSPAGNILTKAETVYRYISECHTFEERHIAYSDIIIEKVILLDVLRRKKKLPIVDHPSKFVSMPWKIAQERCKGPIAERKQKQLLMEQVLQNVPDVTIKGGEKTEKPTIFFPTRNEENT